MAWVSYRSQFVKSVSLLNLVVPPSTAVQRSEVVCTAVSSIDGALRSPGRHCKKHRFGKRGRVVQYKSDGVGLKAAEGSDDLQLINGKP